MQNEPNRYQDSQIEWQNLHSTKYRSTILVKPNFRTTKKNLKFYFKKQ